MDIKNKLDNLGDEIIQTDKSINNVASEMNNIRTDANDLVKRIQTLAKVTETDILDVSELDSIEISELNFALDDVLFDVDASYKKFPKLSTSDIVVSCMAGIIAVAMDVFIVGIPETQGKGGKYFDGSVLTKTIRKLGEGPLSRMYKELESICKVPFDISAVKDGMYPLNHRLRSLSHDPFLGLFFSVFDIIMNTTTFIDNQGCLRVLLSKKQPIDRELCIFYYLGHIISDLFTSKGIPVPGFFLTQFFANGTTDDSIAKIADKMYRNGYDLRHFVSMSTPIAAKSIILSLYDNLTEESNSVSPLPLAIKEKNELNKKLKMEKMNFIANSIAVSGNVLKFFTPPSSCNPSSINSPEWFVLIKSGINMLQMQMRDTSAEAVIENRVDIDVVWDRLEII